MHVVIVESPAKSKTLGKFLGKDYKILASYGHVRDLPSKDGSVDPEQDFKMIYQVSPGSEKQIQAIAKAVKDADIVYLATDPDREGEAISWHVVEALKERNLLPVDMNILRVAFSEITKKAVLDAIANPRQVNMSLVNAQQARRALDYLVGFTLSPILWRKLPGSRSAGRVQSVALRLICEREEAIEAFNSQEYWQVFLDLLTPKKELIRTKVTRVNGEKLEQLSIKNETEAYAIKNSLSSKTYHVLDVEKKTVYRHPQPPFITSTLQQEASRKLGFGATKTMRTAQRLYEGVDMGNDVVGLITYMRTDGVTVSQEAIVDTRDFIQKRYGQPYLPAKQREYHRKVKNAQEAHEAIRPTDITRTPDSIKSYLSDEQYKLYDLIWKRMMASQMQSVALDQVKIQVHSTDKVIEARVTGSTIKFDGFYVLYKEGEDDKVNDDAEGNLLPSVEINDTLDYKDSEATQHFTQPPPRYGEASLVKKMEELGIGRPSTYASIISVLQERNYVRLEKKRFFPEMRGRLVTIFLTQYFKKYVEYDFTANMEEYLDQVSSGEMEWKKLLEGFWQSFSSCTSEVKEKTITEVVDVINEALAPHLFPEKEDGSNPRLCPSCNKGELSLKLGKFGAFLGCADYPACSYTRQLSDASSAEEGEELIEDKVLGKDPQGKEIALRKGPYGFYVQMAEEEGKKPKRQSLPKGLKVEDVTLEKALGLLALPRELGLDPKTGKVIKANIGRFGPYVQLGSLFVSLKQDDVMSVTLERALEIIQASGKLDKGKELGVHPETGETLMLNEGRYGLYIKYKRKNISVPKDETMNTMTLEKALALLGDKETTTKKKPASKKATPKKATKKAPAKKRVPKAKK